MPRDPDKQREQSRRNWQKHKDRYNAVKRERRKLATQMLHEAKDRPCADCGIKYPPYVMDFDHRDPSEKVADLATFSRCAGRDRVLAEIAKCDVVCSNCHRERTYGGNQSWLQADGQGLGP